MNNKDILIQKYLPTVTVPSYEHIPPLETGKTRFLMGEGGLYLETLQPWGALAKQLWRSERRLPYGRVCEHDSFKEVFKEIKPLLKKYAIPQAADKALSGKEWAGYIVFSRRDGTYHYCPVEQNATGAKVEYGIPLLPEGFCLAVDVHSHGQISPFFSHTDDEDDLGGVKIAIVLGDYQNHDGMDIFDYRIRYCIEGFRFPVEGGGNAS